MPSGSSRSTTPFSSGSSARCPCEAKGRSSSASSAKNFNSNSSMSSNTQLSPVRSIVERMSRSRASLRRIVSVRSRPASVSSRRNTEAMRSCSAVIADSSPSHVISWSIRRPTEEQISIPSTTQRSPLVCCMASLSRIRFLVIRCNFARFHVFILRSPAVSERLTFL